MNVREEKAALRRMARTLPRPDYSAAQAAFLALPEVERARTVMLFAGVRAEPDTRSLHRTLARRGKRLAYPVCLPGRALEARLVSALEELVPGAYGIPEPGVGCPAVSRDDIDLILVPCLLCDRRGIRLGHGAGYYDRFLAGYGGVTACLCPPERLQSPLPADAWDVPVSLVVTGQAPGGAPSPTAQAGGEAPARLSKSAP